MYGLVKLANEQTINLNQATREDRLLDQVEAAREQLDAAEANRSPEAMRKADAALTTGLLGGVGLGAGIGAAIGAANNPTSRGKAALLSGAAGGLFGTIPGAIAGAVRYDTVYNREEDPAVIAEMDVAARKLGQEEGRLERHYLTQQRILEQEERRREARRELLGY